MPKRKRSKALEDDVEHLMHKLRKLERKIRNRQSDSNSDSEDSPAEDVTVRSTVHRPETPSLNLNPDDWLSETQEQEDADIPIMDSNTAEGVANIPVATSTDATTTDASTKELKATEEGPSASSEEPRLDDEVLKILGEDPSAEVKYGPDIRKEIANRMQHIAQEGLSKEDRKDLIAKYPLPANCLLIGAPAVNPEIKAALPETVAKRDKGIEVKQKEMASAISCLGEVITSQLKSKDRNNDTLQKLMDLSRILCDIQHADSATRRNFILLPLKKDMKEHLTNTKIDAFLFSEKLSDAIKTAKAVNKSGVELLADSSNKTFPTRRPKTPAPKHLNRRAPAPARRQPAQQRSRPPAAPRAPPPPPPQPAQPYRMSYYAPPPPPPPPPAPPAPRRRF